MKYWIFGLLWLGLGSRAGSQEFLHFRADPLSQSVEQLLAEERLEEAEEKLSDLLPDCQRPADCSQLYYYLGGVRYLLDEVEAARSALDSALALQRVISDREGRIASLCLVGKIAFANGELDQAQDAFTRATELLSPATPPTLATDLHVNRALLLSQTGEHELSMGHLKQALQLTEDHLGTEERQIVLNQISTNYYSAGALDSAAHYFGRLLGEKRTEGQPVMNDLNTLAGVYAELGNYRRAQRYLIEALREAEDARDTLFRMSLSTQVAELYARQQQWEKVTTYAATAAELAAHKRVQLTEAQNRMLLARARRALGTPDQAIAQALLARELYTDLNNLARLADVQLLLAELYENEAQLELAYQNARAASESQRATVNAIGALDADLLLADLQIRLGKLREARSNLEASLVQAKRMNNARAMERVHYLRARVHEQAGDYRAALAAYKAYDDLNDSLFTTENLKMINDLEISYETEKKDKALLAQRVELEQQAAQVRVRNTQLIGLLAVLAALLGTGVLLYFLNQKNRQLDQQRLEALEKGQQAQVLRALLDGEDRERTRVAQELHDGLGTLLATVRMSVGALEPDSASPKEQQAFAHAKVLIDRACESVREMSHNMMPRFLEENGLEQVLHDYVETIERSTDLRVFFIFLNEEAVSLNPEIELATYRIVQELVRNVLKHARATEAIVQVIIDPESLQLTVEDNGHGFTPEQLDGDGMGLDNVRSRVRYFNGQSRTESSLENGTTIVVELPLNQSQYAPA